MWIDLKLFNDAAKSARIIVDDNPLYFRGVRDLEGRYSMIHLGKEWRFEWAIYGLES